MEMLVSFLFTSCSTDGGQNTIKKRNDERSTCVCIWKTSIPSGRHAARENYITSLRFIESNSREKFIICRRLFNDGVDRLGECSSLPDNKATSEHEPHAPTAHSWRISSAISHREGHYYVLYDRWPLIITKTDK